jgi:hypothetical protein
MDKSIELITITLEREAQEIRHDMESAMHDAGFHWWYFIEYLNLFTFKISPKSI